MAKGQQHSNREVRKPKSTTPKKGAADDKSSVTATFAKAGKSPPGKVKSK